jgi:hypothetical protein
MKKELSEKELREFIKNSLKELDVLLPKEKSDWKDEVTNLRATLVDLMKNIENDNFEDGVKKIDSAVKLLNSWKSKIEKLL